MMTTTKHLVLIVIMMASINFSCKKFIDIDPPKDKFGIKQVFENDETAVSAVTGIYSRMASDGTGFTSGDASSVTILAGLSADELSSHSSTLDFFYRNEIQTNSFEISRLWSNIYNYVYATNAIIEGLSESNGVSEMTKKQLQGEAKFIRAFCYFYLVNLFGNVPLILTTDYKLNEHAPRSSKDKVYTQIIVDLIDAENLLTSNYITTERIRPNKWAAKALLSRVYLYTENWTESANKATEVIDQSSIYLLASDLDQVFLKNSNEAIWQLQPSAGKNTNEGSVFILTATPTNVSINPDLIMAFNDPLDTRKSKWIKGFSNTTGTYNYAFKYKIKTTINVTLPVTEYSMVIRLAEMYLIRAEARAKLNLSNLALDDINLIRKRAGMTIPLMGLSSAQVLTEVELQRRLELFSEWGHRWLDLKRTRRVITVLPPLKGATWKDTDVLYPIPDIEVLRNINIGQNAGY